MRSHGMEPRLSVTPIYHATGASHLSVTFRPESLGTFGLATSSRWIGANAGSLTAASRDADGLPRAAATPRLMQASADGR
ncbi:hypothetical protein SAMN05421665_3580 [Yoonia rosea]|uniref:Uncharacterized protein n=1 Tax=Yoonia rosea TaxID=287098 RepID=A0A1R3XKF0_9RHOB|nr:hypothetical protein SAMN05421665_3580 [Yoonia rosea]